MSESRNHPQSDADERRKARADKARKLILEAAGVLSDEHNVERLEGGVLGGIREAENSCRNALEALAAFR